jgi:hypothetical protein
VRRKNSNDDEHYAVGYKWEANMKFLPWIVATVALASLAPTPAPAASGAPPFLVYRIPGLRDDGGGVGVGTATALTCTLYSGVPEDLVVAVRNQVGDLVTAVTYSSLPTLTTLTVETHPALVYVPGAVFAGSGYNIQGSFAIASTTTAIKCTAQVLDASTTKPVGWDLPGIRYNPDPGSQE